VSGFSGSAASAAKKPSPIPAQMTFNESGYMILGDSLGPTYIHDEQGVSCVLHPNGNLIFHPGNRSVTFLFDAFADTGCPLSPGGWVPAASQSASLTVTGLLQMPVGSTATAMAIFTLGNGQGQLKYGWPGYCSNSVQVMRLNQTTWTITAPGGSDIAVLEQPISRHERVPMSDWNMPFNLTVTTIQ
jgi:hypothetical protein